MFGAKFFDKINKSKTQDFKRNICHPRYYKVRGSGNYKNFDKTRVKLYPN